MPKNGKNEKEIHQNGEKSGKKHEIAKSDSRFGNMLKEIRRTAKNPDTDRMLTQAGLAERLRIDAEIDGITSRQIHRWEAGERRIRPDDRYILLGILKVLVACDADIDRDKANEWLRLGGYASLTNLEAGDVGLRASQTSENEYAPNSVHGVESEPPPQQPEHPPTSSRTLLQYLIDAIRFLIDGIKKIVKWDEADEYMRKSWRGIFIHIFSALTSNFRSEGALRAVTWIFLFIGSFYVTRPFITFYKNQPIPIETTALFTLACLIAPILIGLLTRADFEDEFDINDSGFRKRYTFLRLTGGYVGFIGGIIFMVIIAYAVFWTVGWSLAWWGITLLLFFAFIWGHVGAARIPSDRFVKPWNESATIKMELHEADKLFLPTFVILSLFLPLGVMFFHRTIYAHEYGLIFLITVCFAVPVIELWQNNSNPNNEKLLIFFFGTAFPWFIFIATFVVMPPSPSLSLVQKTELALIGIAFWGFMHVCTSAFIRQPRQLTIRGVFVPALVLQLLVVVLLIDLTLGRILTLTTFLIWFLLRRKTEPYLNLHWTIGAEIMLAIASFAVYIYNLIPLLLNLILFLLGSIILAIYAWRSPIDQTDG